MAAKGLLTVICQQIYDLISFPPVDESGERWPLEERFSRLLDPGKKGGEAHNNSLQVPKEMSLHFLGPQNRKGKKSGVWEGGEINPG